MKKIFISLILTFSFLFSTSYGYNITIKDEKIVNKINTKIDLIYKKSPTKVEKLYKKIQKILNTKLKGKENTRIYVLINKINIHLEKILDKNEDDLDFNDLLLGEEKIEKKVIKSTNNKEEIKKEETEKNKIYTDSDMKDFLNDGGECVQFKKYSLNEYKCKKIKKNIDNNNYEINNKYYKKGRSGVYKDCQTGPRGGRYYINSKGRKVYNCD